MHSKPEEEKESLRDKIIGLGERSVKKSYYPQLQQQLLYLEEKSKALLNILEDLEESQKELKDREALLQIAGRTAKFGGWSADPEGKKIVWSEQVAAIYEKPHSYSPSIDELVRFYAPEWRETAKKLFFDCVSTGVPYDQEMEVVTERGRRFWVRTTGEALIDNKGNITRIHGAFQDITEQKHAEEELKKSYEELKELDRLKSEFTALISHELRTPLTSIKGYVELVLDGTMGKLNENQKMCLEVVSDNVSRLSRLISDVLDISKIERGEFMLNMGPINLKDTLEKVLKELIPIASKKQIDLKLKIDDLTTNADKDRITQVFTNLIENAIKFSPENTEVVICGKEELNEGIHITIKDNGIGIPKDEFEKIFDRFYQIDASNKRKRGGTGLGLAVCKNIVQAHAGKIWVESEIGNGSTFHVVIPKVNS